VGPRPDERRTTAIAAAIADTIAARSNERVRSNLTARRRTRRHLDDEPRAGNFPQRDHRDAAM
jgi:hypothetical protein